MSQILRSLLNQCLVVGLNIKEMPPFVGVTFDSNLRKNIKCRQTATLIVLTRFFTLF